MPTNHSKELTLLQKAASEFARQKLIPDKTLHDKYPFGPDVEAVLSKAFELDFFHLTLPEKLGGMGQKISALCTLLETFCREDASLGGFLVAHTISQQILLNADAGGHLQRIAQAAKNVRQFLIACPAFRNPAEMETGVRAVSHNGGYLLSGKLEYLSMGNWADHALVPAVIESIPGYSFFLITMDRKGIDVGDPILSLGIRACPAVDVALDRKQAVIIGEAGKGEKYFRRMAAQLAPATSAMALGIMKGAYNEALQYSKQREQGGRKISGWSEVQMMLANMSIKIVNAELILSRGAMAMENNEPDWEKYAAAAGIHIHEMACDVASEGVQILGGNGYMQDYGQEKRYRDAKHIQAYLGIFPMKKIRYFKQHISREEK